MDDTAPHEFEFDFVISYAGEDEDYATRLRQALVDGGARVFFAPEFQAELWGKNLYEYLAELYNKKGRYCIILVSENYVQKKWTRHEWRSAQERARMRGRLRIHPTRPNRTGRRDRREEQTPEDGAAQPTQSQQVRDGRAVS